MGNEITHYILLVINYSWRLWIIYIFCLRHAVIYLFLIPIHLILSSLKSGLLAAQLAVLRSKAILRGAIPWFLSAELSLQQRSAVDWTCRAVGLNENRPWVFRRSVSLHESTKTKQNKKVFKEPHSYLCAGNYQASSTCPPFSESTFPWKNLVRCLLLSLSRHREGMVQQRGLLPSHLPF